ncbi:SDR family oxidoreductase [Rubrobacter aplysinae]|uniref:SDR family oxidoreductase n=1 Tax=Rubrobacter aplysinae TaxID=909625 RepID=UPI00064C4A0E|nr:SDR family oxidoreductase [Rubrobacter aplysinae]
MSSDQNDQNDQNSPQSDYPFPEFGEQSQEHPGLAGRMSPVPDHGEDSYQGSGKLQGRAAVITGGDSGIGRAVAIAFAREGADVLISYLEAEEEDARDTVGYIEQAGHKAVAMPGDITDEEQCRRVIDRAAEEFGRLDVLVNNAAFQMARGGIAEIPAEEFDHTFKTNIYAPFHLSKRALEHMVPGGVIINTTSIQGTEPSNSLLAYASTKGALVAFNEGLAQETIQRGIRVNSVAPGPVWAPLIPATLPAESVSGFGQGSPTGRPAQPAELAPAYVYLASDESSYINGETIGVTGGMPL